MESATTLRVSYDSNEIDNSYAVAGAAAADVDDDDDNDDDNDGDNDDEPATADDVETVADDYVIALGHRQNTTNEKNDRAATTTTTTLATTTTTTTAAATATENESQLMNAKKTQDLLSLSQLSSYQTQKNASSLKNSNSNSNSIGGASSGGNFQQIGSQRVNGNISPSSASPAHNFGSNGQQVAANGSSIVGPTLSTSSNVRNSAKKVESKYIQPKQQKTDAPMLNYIFDTHSAANKHHHHDQRYGPHFEDVQRVGQPTNMTVQAGSSIHLNCRISLLQDKTVSWVRRNAQNEENALDLLTVGLHAYTGDKRYKMEFQYPNNWRLKIINVKKDDEATYECQISTHPPRVIQINLHVNAPKVMIVDEYGDPLQEKYYEIDSTLQLSCVVRNVAMSSSVVFWKHSENVLNYDVTRGGVSVKTELMEDGANSTLSIAKIHKADSGNYTCSISEFQNFTIVVHILNGESFAELHHGGAETVAHATWQYIMGLWLLLQLLRWMRWNCR
ncbi:hypothetical protein ACLKA6_013594 [Drosophila palustris]